MNMTKQKTLLFIILGLVVSAMGFGVLRALPRWLALREILGSPDCVAMLAVMPEPNIEIMPPANLDLSHVNIGYAKFSLPAQLETHLTAGGRGDAVILESDALVLAFLPPYNVDASEDLLSYSLIKAMENVNSGATIAPHLLYDGDCPDRENARSIVDMRLLAAEARPLPFSAIFMMSNAEFNAYMLKLIMKTVFSPRAERVVPYESAHSVGVLYVYKGDKRGIVELTTHDRRISQTVTFRINETNTVFHSDTLAAFLASYSYTVETSPTRDEIAKMLAARGIKPWVTPEGSPMDNKMFEERALAPREE
jgi:hypothetical protein